MARKDLSPQLIAAGEATLAMLDQMQMGAQAAMWVFDDAVEAWKFCLVTSLVDSAGRRKAYQLLVRAFERRAFPLSLEDVYLRGLDAMMSAHADDLGDKEPVIYRAFHAQPSEAEARGLQRAFEQSLTTLERQSVPA